MSDWLSSTQGMDQEKVQAQAQQFVDDLLMLPFEEAAAVLDSVIPQMDQGAAQAFGTTLGFTAQQATLQADELAANGDPAAEKVAQTADHAMALLTYTMQVFQHHYDQLQAPAAAGESAAASDAVIQAMQAVVDLQGRFGAVMPNAFMGRATGDVRAELIALRDELDALQDTLQTIPELPDFVLKESHTLMGVLLEALARTHEALGDDALAAETHRAAATSFDLTGDVPRAAENRERADRITAINRGDLDTQMKALLTRLESAPPNSLAHVNALVRLGELASAAGDEYGAADYLRRARKALIAMGFQALDKRSMGTFGWLDDIMALMDDKQQAYDAGDLDRAKQLQDELVAALNSEGELAASQNPADQALLAALKQHITPTEPIMAIIVQVRGLWNSIALASAQMRLEDDPSAAREIMDGVVLESETQGVDLVGLRLELDLLAADHESATREGTSQDYLLKRAEMLEARIAPLNIPDLTAAVLLRKAHILKAMNRAINDRLPDAVTALTAAWSAAQVNREYDLGISALSELAETFGIQKAWRKVMSIASQGIPLVEKYRYQTSSDYLQSAYLRYRIGLYAWGVLAAYHLGDAENMLEWSELSKARGTLRQQIDSAHVDASLDDLLAQFAEVTAQVTMQESAAQQEEVLARRRALWDQIQIARYSQIGGGDLPEFSIQAVQSTLDSDEAILSYYFVDPATLLILTLDGQRVIPELRALSDEQRADLKEATDAIMTYAGGDPTPLDAIRDLSECLLPAKGRALLEGKRRLIVSPHRVLHAVPFHALRYDDDHPYLVQRFAVTLAPNLSSRLLCFDPAPGPALLAVAPVGYEGETGGFQPLLGSEREVTQITALYAQRGAVVTSLMYEQATADHLLREIGLAKHNPYSVLHIATHGLSVRADTPMESMMMLRDAVLDGLEIAALELPVDLVVLSACHSGQQAITARGMELPGDEMMGLPAAFFMAGAHAVMGALWAVIDDITAPMLADFHRALLDGAPPEVALQQAMIAYLDAADDQHKLLVYWAAFTITAMGRAEKPIPASQDPSMAATVVAPRLNLPPSDLEDTDIEIILPQFVRSPEFRPNTEPVVYHAVPYLPPPGDRLALAEPWRIVVEGVVNNQVMRVGLELYSPIYLGGGDHDEADFIVDLAPLGAHELGVSHRHALIKAYMGRVTITDFRSKNGTVVNGEDLAPDEEVALTDPTQLELGGLMLRIRLMGKAAKSQSG